MITTRPDRHRAHPTRALPGALLLLFVLLSALCLQPRAFAQGGEADPPGRVARLSELAGNVWVYRPEAGDWVQATLNLPLTTGDTLATEAGARAELQIGSSLLRLDSGSELEVSVLDDSRISLQLRAGALAVRVRNPAETGRFELATEEGRFLVQAAGRYRFDHGTGSSFVAVDTGQVRYEYASSALTVSAGQRAEFWIDANGAAQYGLGGMTYDAFTAWNNERDRAIERSSVAARYVSPEMTGVEDLDRYGSWEPNTDYGAVWIPATVAADWAPYTTGHWAWVRPWGWTWVDDAPWGFAPFHYGRWVNLRNRWCWTPGVREPRPVYAPALVGWVGPPRGGLSVGVGVGPAVGWFPLAPREVFLPGYRSSPGYIRTINTPYVRRGDPSIDIAIRNPLAPRDFENRRWPRAVTVVPATAFGERRSLALVAAQYRDAPWTREFARPNGPAPTLVAPPIAPPPMASNRPADGRPLRPPPGFIEQRAGGSRPEQFPGPSGAGGNRPDSQRPPPGADPRDRHGRPDRAEAMPPNTERPSGGPADVAGPSRVQPLPVRPGFGAGDRTTLPNAAGGPGNPGNPGNLGSPGVPGNPPYRGNLGNPGNAPNPGISANPGSPGNPAAPATRPPAATAAGPAPVQRPEASPVEAQEPGRMRAFPVNRGDRRENDGRFGDGSRPQQPPRSDAAPPSVNLPNPVSSPAPVRPAPSAEPVGAPPGRRPGETPGAAMPERGMERPSMRQGERPPMQPGRPEGQGGRPELIAPRPAEVQTPAAPPPQAPKPPAPAIAPAAAAPPRPIEAPAPPRRVEGPRPSPAAEPQRPAVAPERRNDPNASR